MLESSTALWLDTNLSWARGQAWDFVAERKMFLPATPMEQLSI